ncbi:hypothetical protein KDK95_06025 [Actinospica sp. MGRD01-02]|uniref:DUF5667 domain-containing protein n=1 Tax=Actinospica acidithermotolerans TaxID=2828514 RepID=A0A941EDL9_9ACTN|nr:DUF5667 domain-containing protein [Actinospica acidithermotolerans]MBR7825859.1 hypothetical protein [Actinospica acidithermotolerans]
MNDRQQAEQFAALVEAHAASRADGHTGQAGRAGDGAHAVGRVNGSAVGRGAHGAHGGGGEGALGSLVALAERVSTAAYAVPGPGVDFRDALRARLVAEAPALVAEGAAAGRRSGSRVPAQRAGRGRGGARHSADTKAGVFTGISASWRRRLLAAGVGVAVATGSVGGIAIASAGAVPGDPLYNAKKIFESLQLSLSGSPTDQGRDYLHLADVRLGEIDALLQRPDVDQPGSQTQQLLKDTLSDLRTMVTNGGDLLLAQVQQNGDQTALHALSDFLLTERQRVEDLSWRLPAVLQSQPPQIVALMDQYSRELQAAAQKAANHAQGPGLGQTGAAGQPGGGDASSAAPSATGSATAAGSASASDTASKSASSAKSSSSTSASASPKSSSTISVAVGGNVLPSIGVTIPSVLGLPEIDVNLGGGSSASSSPTS